MVFALSVERGSGRGDVPLQRFVRSGVVAHWSPSPNLQ